MPKFHITDAELEILGVLWERGSSTVREVYEVVIQRRPLVYTGILKLLQNMSEKKLVQRDETEKAHRYVPSVNRDEVEAQVISEFSDRVFSGDIGRLAMRALEAKRASKEDLLAIRRLINKTLSDK